MLSKPYKGVITIIRMLCKGDDFCLLLFTALPDILSAKSVKLVYSPFSSLSLTILSYTVLAKGLPSDVNFGTKKCGTRAERHLIIHPTKFTYLFYI